MVSVQVVRKELGGFFHSIAAIFDTFIIKRDLIIDDLSILPDSSFIWVFHSTIHILIQIWTINERIEHTGKKFIKY